MSDETKRTDTRREWDRLPDESDCAWRAFQAWLYLPPHRRSLRNAYQAYQGVDPKTEKPKQPSKSFADWSREHRWRERHEAYDQTKRADQMEETAGYRKDAMVAVFYGIIEAVTLQNEELGSMSANERSRYLNALRRLIDPLEPGSIIGDEDGDYEYDHPWFRSEETEESDSTDLEA